MPKYESIRAELEDQGYPLTDELYDELLTYARRKAEVAGKDEGYIPYLLPDVIKEYFFRLMINARSLAMMDRQYTT